MIQWTYAASNRVSIEIESPFSSNPTVRLRLLDESRGSAVAVASGSGLTWPLTMTRVANTETWEAVVPYPGPVLAVGDEIVIEVSFDDGTSNNRLFYEEAEVVLG